MLWRGKTKARVLKARVASSWRPEGWAPGKHVIRLRSFVFRLVRATGLSGVCWLLVSRHRRWTRPTVKVIRRCQQGTGCHEAGGQGLRFLRRLQDELVKQMWWDREYSSSGRQSLNSKTASSLEQDQRPNCRRVRTSGHRIIFESSTRLFGGYVLLNAPNRLGVLESTFPGIFTSGVLG